MSKPRDSCGLDYIVGATAVAIQVAHAAGLENDDKFIRKLAEGFHRKALEEYENDKNRLPK